MQPCPVLIVGSAGAFGRRITELLARDASISLVLGGRTRASLEAQAGDLSRQSGRMPRILPLDAERVAAEEIAEGGARLVINASGPFQGASYGLARAAIAAGCHYVDLADSRAFVNGFLALDAAARAADVLAVTGASSVPGLSSAVVAQWQDAFAEIAEIDVAISPGNAFDPGLATVAAVLGGVGQRLTMLRDGEWQEVHGWQGLSRGSFGGAGRRWLSHVDVPDLDLFPAHVAGVRTVRFRAGLEVAMFHLGLWGASWLVRMGAVRSLAPLAPRLAAIKRRLSRLGSDRGGMIVEIRGRGHDGRRRAVTWRLVAGSGHGPYVPALVSVALAKRLARGVERQRGARACYALAGLADILAEAKGLDIATETTERPLAG